MDIARQLAESYRALHQPPGSLTTGASAQALSASCIPGSAPPGPPAAESQPSARDPHARCSARLPRSSFQAATGSDRKIHSNSPHIMNEAPASRPDTSANSPAAQCIQTTRLRPTKPATRLSPPLLVSAPGAPPGAPGQPSTSSHCSRLSRVQPCVSPYTHAGAFTPTGRSTR